MIQVPIPHVLSPGIVPLFAIVLTLGAYLLGVEIEKRLRNPLANPVLIAIVIIGVSLRLLHLSYQDYFTGAQFIHFLLGPATVALAIPMVRALEHMRRGFWSMMSALLAGSLIGLISGYAIVRLLGGSQQVALSMAPKSLTTPIAIAVSASIGGIPSLSAVLAILGGIHNTPSQPHSRESPSAPTVSLPPSLPQSSSHF
jgi:putative effector of murein hydrolase